MKLKRFTIITRWWARGGMGGRSSLCNSSGFKCCLGFMAQKAGAKRVRGFDFPHNLPDVMKVLPQLADGKGKQIAHEIAVINDKDSISDSQRKNQIAPLFAKIGWKPVYK